MKRFTLALLAAGGLWFQAGAQANINIQAPQANATSQLRAPNGTTTHVHMKGVVLVLGSELTALTGSIVNSIGFDLTDGTGTTNNPGTLTIWLQNTPNTTYQKGTAFSTATVGMTQHYTGPYTVPSTNGQQTVTLAFTPQFTYTGGGIYVAYEWTTVGPYDPQPATYEASNPFTGNGLAATSFSSSIPTPDMMTITDFRPAFIWNAVNTATNEVGVVRIDHLGKASKLDAGQIITAEVRNNSVGTLNNIVVNLNITGANPFADTKTVTSLAGGASQVVSFNPYSPTANGNSTVEVSIAADENLANNELSRVQIASCQTVALNNFSAGSFTSSAYGAGASTSGRIYSFRYSPGSNLLLEGVQVVVPGFSNAGNSGKTIYPVLQDNTGAILAQGNNVTITGGMMDQFSTLSFTSPVTLLAGADYNIGIGMPTNGYFPIGTFGTNTVTGYYSSATTGGPLSAFNVGDMSIQGVVTSSVLQLQSMASKTLVCPGDVITITVSAASSVTFTTNPGGITATSFTASPQPQGGGTSGPAFFTTTGVDTVSGCPTQVAALTVSVDACTGIGESLANYAEIRMFPNPAVKGVTTLDGLQGVNTIEVMNVVGQVVLTSSTSRETSEIDISSLPKGQYLIKVANDKQQVRVFKLLNE